MSIIIRLCVLCSVTVDTCSGLLHGNSMLRSSRIKCRKLKRFFAKDDSSRIRADWRRRVGRVLNALDVATHPSELDMPGYDWHELSGDRKGTYSVLVSRNWRITFCWDHEGPLNVDLEDYHES